MVNERLFNHCTARVEFTRSQAHQQDEKQIVLLEGSFVCTYPNGACQLANRLGLDYDAQVVEGACILLKSS